MAKRKNNKRVRSKRVRSKRIRSKRVQRTKKTRINRRSKKTKRTQVNRRIKRNRRMKGGMDAGGGGEGLFGTDLSLQRSLDLLPPLEDDIELAGSLSPLPAGEQVRVYMSINGIEFQIGLSTTFGQFKQRLINAGLLSNGQDIFFVEKPESQMIEFNRVEYINLDPMKTYIVFKTGGSKKKNKKGKRKHMKPKASIGKSGGGGALSTSQEKALLSGAEE